MLADVVDMFYRTGAQDVENVRVLAEAIDALSPFEYLSFAYHVVDQARGSKTAHDVLWTLNVALARVPAFVDACKRYWAVDEATRASWHTQLRQRPAVA